MSHDARVAAVHRGGGLELITGAGPRAGFITGRLRHAAAGPLDLPAVGDWVACDPESGAVHAVHERTSALVRAARDGREPQVLRCIAFRELGERTRIAQLSERPFANGRNRGVDRDFDQRVLIAELDDSAEAFVGLVFVIAARVRAPQLGRAFAGEIAQAAFGLRSCDLGEHGGFVDLLDRDTAHADVAVGSSNLNKDGSVVCGQSLDGLGADADVAVAILGAKKISNPHGQGGNLCGLPPGLKRWITSIHAGGPHQALHRRCTRCTDTIRGVEVAVPARAVAGKALSPSMFKT